MPADSGVTTGGSGTYLGSLSADAFASLGSMEGMYEALVEPASTRQPAADTHAIWPGYVLAGLLAALSYAVCAIPTWPFQVASPDGIKHPVSAAIVAILVGLLVRNVVPIPAAAAAGCKRIVKRYIPIAIVLSGAGLSLTAIADVGPAALGVTVVCMAFAIAVAYYAGRALGLGSKAAMLIGAGTGVCGNSAIVAVAPLIDANDEDLVLSIGTVNLYGLVIMLLCPIVGGLLHLSNSQYGVWTGASIHAIPQVVAAGFTQGVESGTMATAVKLFRVTLLAPMVFVLALLSARRQASAGPARGSVVIHYARFVPWFVWGFLVTATLATLGLFPTLHFSPTGAAADWLGETSLSLVKLLTLGGSILLTWAMAAIGLEVNLRVLASVSSRALLVGLIASVALAAASLGLIYAFI